jgi:hypothetical protein
MKALKTQGVGLFIPTIDNEITQLLKEAVSHDQPTTAY